MDTVSLKGIEKIVEQVVSELLSSQTTMAAIKNTDVPNRARVAMLTGAQRIEVKSFDIPAIGPNEMLVKVEGCGICGTDVHEYKGDPFGLIPVVLGHEGTGEIVKIGENIKRDTAGKSVKLGDKIVTCVIPCGHCRVCREMPHRSNLCENTGIYGLMKDDAYHFNGWFGDYVIIRENATFFNVSEMSMDLRMLIEPAAVVIHAYERAKKTGLIQFNSKVVVQGCGPIGLLLIAVLRTAGIEHIIAVDGNQSRLELAKRFGADQSVNVTALAPNETAVDRVRSITDGGADFVFQCTGVPQAASSAWKFVKTGGGLCEVGFFVDNGDCTINPHHDLCAKEITAIGSWVYTPQDYSITFDFIKRAKGIGLPLEELITHRYGLEELNEAMAMNISLKGIKIAFVNR